MTINKHLNINAKISKVEGQIKIIMLASKKCIERQNLKLLQLRFLRLRVLYDLCVMRRLDNE